MQYSFKQAPYDLIVVYFQLDDSGCTYAENVDGSKVSMGINSFLVMIRLADLDPKEWLKETRW